MRCDDFLAWLEDPSLQEGGPWPQEILVHARRCPRCAEILAIFQAIPGEVSLLPRSSGDDEEPAAVLITIHDGIPVVTPASVRRRRAAVRVALAAAAALLLVALPWHVGSPPAAPGDAAPLAAPMSALDVTPLATIAPWADSSGIAPAGPLAADAVDLAVTDRAGDVPERSPRTGGNAPGSAIPDPADSFDALAAATRRDEPHRSTTRRARPTPGDDPAPAVARTPTAPARASEDLGAVATRGTDRPSDPENVETPRVRVGQGVVVMNEEWGAGTGYGGEIGLQQRFWFNPHMGLTLDGGVRYGVAPGFDALPDDRPRTTTGGTVAGAGSVMFAVRARPAMVGLGVGFSAGEWDPGPDACSDLQRAVPERNVACEDWSYVTPDLVASVEFDVHRDIRLGVRWTGHEEGYELGRNGEIPTGGAWINRVTLEATFRPSADGMTLLAKKSRRDRDEAPDARRTAISSR